VTRVRLMEKPDCGLCDEALASLRRLTRRTRLDIERVDVTHDPSLERRYVLRVPVLVIDEDELDVAGLDEAAIGRWLEDVGA
jgi:hypothetical protein